MCGIAGLLDVKLTGLSGQLYHVGSNMAFAIAHRGPDAQGVWTDAQFGVVLAHSRLSVVDLSPAGEQPMVSQNGRLIIAYNGEIYNSQELREHPRLSNHKWRGHSDTEVILESIAIRGLEETVAELNGMFAFALWDRKTHKLHLVRDRIGIKPLFYAQSGSRFMFGSEVKALLPAGLNKNIDPSALSSFLRYGYVPAPFGIYKKLRKVLPGEIVTLDDQGALERSVYWCLSQSVVKGSTEKFDFSDTDAISELDVLLQNAVSRQMVSDVPLGAFLSGGVDSSLVVALMSAGRTNDIRTFSIGFPDLGFDESPYAEAVARHLGTDHTSLACSDADALSLVPAMAEMYDEPFADSSQIPTHLVSALARRNVTVALSGDGGDELFAGYNRYVMAGLQWPRVARIPKPLRALGGALIEAIPVGSVDSLSKHIPSFPKQLEDKLAKLASVLPLEATELYNRLVSQIPEPSIHISAEERNSPFVAPDGLNLVDRMRYRDMVTYLPDDILQKVDRASMSVGLEVRPPLLDHQVVEFAWRLPERFLIRNGQSKWLLKSVLSRYVPAELMERPKMGFGVPLNKWLRGPLKEWAGDLITSKNYGAGLLAPDVAAQLWNEHIKGQRNHGYQLWTLLTFESWRRHWSAT